MQTSKHISLNDGWAINSVCIHGQGITLGFAGDEQPPKKPTRTGDWLASTVPGCVQETLLENNLLPEPYMADNLDHWRWVEDREWWYRKTFKSPDAQKVRLYFDCLDTCATVYLNGEEIAQHRTMFRPLEIDITDKLRSGSDNVVAVRFDPTIDWSEFKPGDGTSGFPSPHRVHTRKAQYSFGWDIAPRLMTVGIGGNVMLKTESGPRITSAYVRTLNIEGTSADLELVVEVESACEVRGKIAGVAVTLSGEGTLRLPLHLDDVTLWQVGKAHLYDANLEVVGGMKKAFRFGVRTVELVQEPQHDGGTSFYFRINGKIEFIRGLNWTPGDAIISRMTEDRISELVGFAEDAHVNLLRVWGGGQYEPDCFYEMCDEKGILVWQDFMLGCGIYPQSDSFAAELDLEARYQVRRLRHHASLVMWAGDNENDCFYYYAGKMNFREDRPTREVLPAVIADLDPDTPFIESSPISYNTLDPLCDTEGDNHLWDHDAPHDASPYKEDNSRFMSEMGRLSLPSMDVINSFLPKESQWPLQNPLWRYHSADTEHIHFGDRIESLIGCLQSSGRTVPDNLEDMIDATQKLQADALTYWIEKYAGSDICGGIIPWNLADCWPQLSDAIVAYPSSPKQAFAAVAKAYGAIAHKGSALENTEK